VSLEAFPGGSAAERLARGKARFPHALEPLRIRGVEFTNRLFFAPMGVDLASPGGGMSPELEEFLLGMARSGCGSIVLSNASVSPRSALQSRGLRLFTEAHAAGMSPFLRRAAAEQVVVGIQLQHYGGQGTTTHAQGLPLLTPSGIGSRSVAKKDPEYRTQVMSLEDIQQVQAEFATAAALCREAGARMVQLQASNGYLLSSFLSPHTNVREDAYGGSPVARARMLVETVRAVRAALGGGAVLSVRLGIDDGLGGKGLVPEDLREVIPLLEEAGVDLFEFSFYIADTFGLLMDRTPESVRALGQKVAQVRGYCRVPVGFAGLVEGLEQAEALIATGTSDLVGMARALFADNDLLLKAVEGRNHEIHRCLWDGKCFKDKSNPRFDRVYCCVNPKYKRPE
jgi:2,4-dienoyl-CoA reductase-like NADH-dependent reductase (Old Yellow Enzyme family)